MVVRSGMSRATISTVLPCLHGGNTLLRHLSRRSTRAAAFVASAGLVAAGLLVSSPTTANPGADAPEEVPSADQPDGGHEPKHPLKIKEKRDAQKAAALERIIRGKSPFPKGTPKGQQIPLETEGTDRVFVVLAEFGNARYPGAGSTACGAGCFTDTPPFNLPDPEPTTFDGPLHNQIPEPDRSKDNSTIWQEDFNREHYEDMYFNRMKEYYRVQSSGRYSIDGDVTEWVKVPYNQALYGRGFCGTPPGTPVTTCASTKALIRDAMAVWVDNQLKAGQTMAQIQDYLKTFDYQDRYDVDGDGNYREPDGFIDHFQIVHAGGDEAASDPIYGTDAIWSHRWYANLQQKAPGVTGVNIGSNGGAYGLGTTAANPVPNNPTGVWVGDYTIQPENGGLGVFAHEYAHDLGLPDLYDTSGNLGGGENNTGFWTLMSSGSNIGDGGDTTGDAPVDMGVWELLQLGWLDQQGDDGPGPFYELLQPGERKEVRLGNNTPATTGGAQALVTRLPDLTRDRPIGTPFAGSQMFWSTEGNNLETTMTRTGVSGTNLTAKVDTKIEVDWDYAYLEASKDNGATWQIVPTNRSTNTDPNHQNEGNGITGDSKGWVDLTATLPAGTNAVRFRYWTDVAAVERGIFIDNIAIDGTVIGSAETDAEGWVFDGFKRTSGVEVEKFLNAYVAENRQYDGYDTSLKTAYNFGWLQTQPDRVQHFPYQNGVLISYWNTMYSDNNVSVHPGAGEVLPVDAHPQLTHWSDGTLMRPRFLSYDSTFGGEATDAISLQEEYRVAGGPVQTRTGSVASQAGVRVFDDRLTWWYGSDGDEVLTDHDNNPATPMVLRHPGRYQVGWYSVNPPKTGTTMQVEDFQGNGTVKVRVNW